MTITTIIASFLIVQTETGFPTPGRYVNSEVLAAIVPRYSSKQCAQSMFVLLTSPKASSPSTARIWFLGWLPLFNAVLAEAGYLHYSRIYPELR